MHRKLTLILLIFFSNLSAQHKIIYLIAPPRTLSTVFLRAMHARGDMAVYNEPCEYCFLAKHKPDELQMYSDELPFKTFEEIKTELEHAREKKHVFAKDTPYATYECFYHDDAFLTDPNIEFCFLIRDPHASLISFHKLLAGEILTGFDWITEWLVYKQQYALFKKISKVRGKAPVIISSEELTENPEKIMQRFCDRMQITYNPSMISWPSLEHSFNPRDWNDYTSLEACELWHKNAINSTHFTSCKRDYKIDAQGEPTFVELDESIRSTVKEIYNYYMKSYKKMYKYRIK